MGLLGYWRLNGNSNDASGNGYNGTDVNMTYEAVSGFNGSAKFTNATTRITASASATAYGSGNRTISLWVKGSSASGQILFGNRNNSVSWIVLKGHPTNCWTEISNNYPTNYNVYFISRASLNDVWHHVVLVINGNDIFSVFDGKYESHGTWTPYNTNSGAVTRFGHYYESPNYLEPLSGNLCNIASYNVALPFSTIKNEYSLRKGFF